MYLHIVEVTNGFNHGKFGIGRYSASEWEYPSAVPELGGRRLMPMLGFTREHLWVLDMQTGEGAMFRPGGIARADLAKRRVWVCPMFEPFLEWLYAHQRAWRDHHPGRELAGWWSSLPAYVELPDAPGALHGHRRPGP